ncbi:hypothetical protein [Moraxella lacunata]|uniref:hypothetical protein n=1 Tax=Moraxella lacunata TaxID=477 RepID=UPI003EE17C68
MCRFVCLLSLIDECHADRFLFISVKACRILIFAMKNEKNCTFFKDFDDEKQSDHLNQVNF